MSRHMMLINYIQLGGVFSTLCQLLSESKLKNTILNSYMPLNYVQSASTHFV